MNKIFLFVLILGLASILRLVLLGSVPISMSDDEIREGMSAYSFVASGKDLYGMSFPFSFNLDGFVFAPIPIYIVGFFIGIFGLSEFSVRIAYAISGIVSVIGVYFLSKIILNNRAISLLSMASVSVSVWAINVSRFAHQGIFSLTFMIWACYFFLKADKKNNYPLYIGLVLFFAAFYSYAAIKVIVIPVVIFLLFLKLKEFTRRQMFITLGSIVVIALSFLILSRLQNAAQYGGGQFFFLDSQKAETQVELDRRRSDAPEILEKIYYNKLTYWSGIFFKNYLHAFSQSYLFFDQEQSGIYSMWKRGQLYLFELPLLIMGLAYLLLKKRKQFLVIGGLLLIAPLPSGVGVATPTYTMRAIFMIPFLYILIGVGIYSFLHFIKNKILMKTIYLLVIVLYIFSVGGYITQYYYDWYKANASYFSKSTKDMVNYLDKHKEKYREITVARSNHNTFLHYAFYEKMDIAAIHEYLISGDSKFGNIDFMVDCPDIEQKENIGVESSVLYILDRECGRDVVGDEHIKDYQGNIIYQIIK